MNSGTRSNVPRRPKARTRNRRPAAPTSWDPLAGWYDGWVGEGGSEHHRQVAVPATLRLLDPRPGEHILDLGSGQGVLAPHIIRAGAHYTGVDASPRMVEMAQRRHGNGTIFLVGDGRRLETLPQMRNQRFDAAVLLLSLQDMDPLAEVVRSTSWLLTDRARIVILLTHPSFRVPRQSGWGWDEDRKLVYRRVDRYLTPLPVPMKQYVGPAGPARTRSFHRPVSEYVNTLSDNGLFVDRMEEIPGHKLTHSPAPAKAEDMARREIPLFLGLRARRCESPQ